MLKFGGKPHWGKKHDLTYSQLSSLYNTQLQRFVDVRNKLDPQRIFTNDYLRRVLEDWAGRYSHDWAVVTCKSLSESVY